MILGLAGCASRATQMEVARDFWTAMMANDLDKARTFVKTDNINDIDIYDAFAVEKIDLKAQRDPNEKSAIPTTLIVNEAGKQKAVQFKTILEEEDGGWKVNFDKTSADMQGSTAPEKQ